MIVNFRVISVALFLAGTALYQISMQSLDRKSIGCSRCKHGGNIKDIYMGLVFLYLIALTNSDVWFYFIFLYGISLILKAGSMQLYKEPPIEANCKPKMLGPYMLTGCRDLMFSSHTAFLVLIAFLVTFYSVVPAGSPLYLLFVVPLWIFVSMCLVMIVKCKAHYTKDVICSLVVCSMLMFLFTKNLPSLTKLSITI